MLLRSTPLQYCSVTSESQSRVTFYKTGIGAGSILNPKTASQSPSLQVSSPDLQKGLVLWGEEGEVTYHSCAHAPACLVHVQPLSTLSQVCCVEGLRKIGPQVVGSTCLYVRPCYLNSIIDLLSTQETEILFPWSTGQSILVPKRAFQR